MPQINDIRELAQQNARYVSNSPQDWMSYLDVAARLYRYSFTDALLIHAQRPDATACAELELWNQKMSRWVNRGAKGIALLDDTGPRTKLRYVFDIADTHLVRGGKTPLLWNLDSHEHEQAILDHLEDTYGLSQIDSMNAALLELAQQLTADNLDEAMDGLAYEVADTFLEELDEDNIRVRFRELMTNSVFYTLSRRCGQEPMDVLDDDDFIRIVDFNKLPVLSFLGNAVSEQCEAVLFDIGREMRKIYKKEITQQLEKSVDSLYNTNTDFSTLKRETEENTTKGGQENGVDVLPQGRLSVPESGREGRAADHREVRDAAQDVPEREPQELVSEYADERQTEPASGADRGSSGEPGGNPAGQPEREVSGTEQGERPAGMGGTSEQPDSDGRRDRLEGIGVQLTEPTTEQDLSEAEEEIASAFSLPDLPTVEQQIRAIEEPIRARYADEIALDPEVIDEILCTGSNRSKGQLRLIYNFMVEKTPEEYTEFVKNEYGTGGKGFEIDGAKYAVWFDDLGLRIAAGDTAKGGTIVNAFLSWEDVSNRIHELLRQGEYAPQAVLDAARQNALQEHAQTLAYMERDLADGVAEAVFQDTEIFRGGFPELTDRLAGLLDDTDFLTDLNDRLSALGEAYAEDKDLMRMHFYKPDKVAALFQQFAKPYQNYSARNGFHWNEYKKFITEDEINAYFTRGSNYSDSRLAIYSFFLNHEDKKERADFLKDHYGIGGSSHALCGADDSHEDHDGRGIVLERGSYGNPDARVQLNWNQAAGRIDQLIRDSEYLKPADYSRMPAYEREQMAMRVMGFYHHLPNDVERPYPQDLYHEEGRKALVEKLEAPEQAVELLEQMDNALLSVPLDSGEYERKAESLAILHQYVEGTYTIFPEKKRAVEIAVPEQGQMSMFDFMEQEPQSKEQSTAAAVEKPQKAKVVARYQSTVMMQEGYIEDIAILQYPDGKFYNHYNYDEETGTGTAETGPFNSLNDAKSVIRQTREDAKAVESFENQPKQTYSRENGSFLYLENDHLYRVERSNAYDVYLKDMENSAVAGRVIPLPSYSETLAKNPLNDFLKLDADHTQKDSRCVYKECLYTLLEKVERSEIYPLLRDRDTTEEEAENLIREKIKDLFASSEVENATYSEAIDTWAHFGEWIQEDIFQRTYQDVITDRRDAVALYQDSKDAPQWVRGIMAPYAAEEKAVEPTLQPLPLDEANEYNALKERYPDALVGYEQHGKQAIHEAIADNYDGMYLGDGAVDQVVRQYGMERVGYILANTLHHKSYDGRFSHSNKEWAEQVSTPEHNADRMTFRTDWVVDSHPAILDGFVTMFRKELEAQKEQEQPFVKQFYVVENMQAAPLKIERFGNLDDAMSQYQALPNHYMKALGVEKNPDPLPGSLDILQCRNGIDTIVEDYKTVPGWDNPYIQNHVVQLLQGALAVQDVELAYELPDAYFHIQTCDDGFDYTLYNKDFTERDGGILETDGDKPVQEAMTELLAEFGCDAAEGKVMDAAELREQADTVAEQQAEVLKEKLAAERPAPKETLSFYVAECLEFTFAGEFHDHLTMEEALEAYDKIPSERMNADKCIGFCIEEDGGFVGMYELVVNDKVQRENINSINYFRDDKLVQQAIADMEKLMEARQKSKEQERSSTKKSVLDALRSLKAKKQDQPAQEQDKPKKAKRKGMEL